MEVILISGRAIHSIFVLGPSALDMGKVASENLKLRNLRYNTKYLSRDIGIIKTSVCTSNYPSRIVETTFLERFEICLPLVVNNNKHLSDVVDGIIFGISIPNHPSRTVESNSLRSFWNFSIFCLLYFHINNNKFSYDKFKSGEISDSAYSICF